MPLFVEKPFGFFVRSPMHRTQKSAAKVFRGLDFVPILPYNINVDQTDSPAERMEKSPSLV